MFKPYISPAIPLHAQQPIKQFKAISGSIGLTRAMHDGKFDISSWDYDRYETYMPKLGSFLFVLGGGPRLPRVMSPVPNGLFPGSSKQWQLSFEISAGLQLNQKQQQL
jgi:hypothetical protein